MRPALGWACSLAAAAVLAAFLVGRVATDRWLITQYLHWLPGLPTLLACAVALGASRLLWTTSTGLRRVRRGLLGVLLLACAWVLIVEWRLYNVVGGSGPAGPRLSIIHFNASGKPTPELQAEVLALTPDLVVLANLRSRESLPAIREAMSSPQAGANLIHADRFTVVSRFPVVEFGRATLGFEGAVFLNRDYPDLRDPGTAAWFRLDTKTSFGRDLVVWALDLPSDPTLPRWDVMAKSMDAIEGWTLLSAVRQEGGNYAPGPEHPPGFPPPDVIIGDFNTPRGSAAIARLALRAGGTRGPALESAHAAAGVGPAGTYPAFLPSWIGWGIDQAFVASPWVTTRYDTFRVGDAWHQGQRVVVSAPGGTQLQAR